MLLEAGYQFLPGHAYGQQQATLLVKVAMTQQTEPDTRAFDALLADQFELPETMQRLPAEGPAAVIERLMLAHLVVQQEHKIPVFGLGRLVHISDAAADGRVQTVWAAPCVHPQASLLVLQWAARALSATSGPAALDTVLTALRTCQEKLRAYALPGTNPMHFLRAAFEMRVPTRRLSGEIFGFGLACRMRLLQSSITDETNHIGVALVRRKQSTAAVLRQHGIPVPSHEAVRDCGGALQAASRLGYPVVVKPDDQEQGHGVFAGLKTPQALEEAFRQTSAISKNILVEKHHDGLDYRLTVFRGQVVKVLLRSPGTVVGDGVHTVAELVTMEQNTVQHRRTLRQRGRASLELDAEALGLLRERGQSLTTVPAAGEQVVLRRKSNISAGGNQSLVPLDRVHPDNQALAARACEAVRLDLCGVDLLVPDIGRSWLETGGVIIELNAQPQIGISLDPGVYARILTGLGDSHWSIPLQLVICESASQMPSPDEMVALCGACDGQSSASGVWVAGRQMVANPPANGFEAARTLLLQRDVASAVCCLTVDEVRRLGLPAPFFDRIVMLQSQGCDEPSKSNWDEVRQMVGEHTGSLVVDAPSRCPLGGITEEQV
jgi:cyanophycin synthetase